MKVRDVLLGCDGIVSSTSQHFTGCDTVWAYRTNADGSVKCDGEGKPIQWNADVNRIVILDDGTQLRNEIAKLSALRAGVGKKAGEVAG